MKLKVALTGFLAVILLILIAFPLPVIEVSAESLLETTNESISTSTLADGLEIEALLIDSPPDPSPEYAEERATSLVTSPDRATTLSNFPSYDWVYGCSAVSAAMIAAYYDNNGYSNLYTGPTNGGVMPITDTGWGTWSDGTYSYPNNPLVASRAGLDGRGALDLGSIDDYWVTVNSTANDPYITGAWTQHTWGAAVGDYMKTSQSTYENNDGSTWFYTYTGNGRLSCDSMPGLYDSSKGYYLDDLDGTYGRKLFYEARGYTIDDANCYAQKTDNKVSGGFSLADFQAEIDAGNPVLINVTGHSMVGFGYSGSTIYIRDTWDSNPAHVYSMTWGGTFEGRELLSVSIVHLESVEPGAFKKDSPSDDAIQWTDVTLSWGGSSKVDEYEYCIDMIDNDSCDGSWISNGTSTSVNLSGLNPDSLYQWQVRATNEFGTVYADSASTAFWAFSTLDPSAFDQVVFLPFIRK